MTPWAAIADTNAQQSDSEQASDAAPAQEREVSIAQQEIRSEITQVLKHSDFGANKTTTQRRWKQADEAEAELYPEWMIRFLAWLENSDGSTWLAISKVVAIILWVVFIGIIVVLIYTYRERLGSLVRELKATQEPAEPVPTSMFGLEVSKESLPQNVLQKARHLFDDGQIRQSLSLLFRAALSNFMHDYGCRFEASDTEQECYQKVTLLQSPISKIEGQASEEAWDTVALARFMKSLVRLWQQLAYAHQEPSKLEFDQLCEQWQEVF